MWYGMQRWPVRRQPEEQILSNETIRGRYKLHKGFKILDWSELSEVASQFLDEDGIRPTEPEPYFCAKYLARGVLPKSEEKIDSWFRKYPGSVEGRVKKIHFKKGKKQNLVVFEIMISGVRYYLNFLKDSRCSSQTLKMRVLRGGEFESASVDLAVHCSPYIAYGRRYKRSQKQRETRTSRKNKSLEQKQRAAIAAFADSLS